MIEASTSWNQPYRSASGTNTLFLGVRLRATAQTQRLPVHAVVLLDLSSSMAGAKLLAACQAVHALWQELRDEDLLSVVSFASDTAVVLPWSQKGRTAESRIRSLLSACRAEGVTDLRAGLREALRVAGESPQSGARFVWLVTDGDPTTRSGGSVDDLSLYLEDAGAAARGGLVLGALGVGPADAYRADFLRDLADRGRGAFCYAATPEILGTMLRQQLQNAQRVTALAGQLSLRLRPGNTLLNASRMVPSYTPLDLASGGGVSTIAVGPLAQPETVVLCEIASAAPFAAGIGIHEVGVLEASAEADGGRQAATPLTLRIQDVLPGSPELLERDRLMEQLRISMLLARNVALRERAVTATEKLRATEVLLDLSRKTGDERLSERLRAEAAQLQKNQLLSKNQEAQATQDIRATSVAAYQQYGREPR